MADTGHYYRLDGTACHEVMGTTTGRLRPTTIADARKMGLLPSVTTCLKAMGKDALTDWLKEQVAKAAYANPAQAGESEDQYVSRLLPIADQVREKAADFGTGGHKALEDALQGRPFDPAYDVEVAAVERIVVDEGIQFLAHEKRTVNSAFGYAGTLDGLIQCPKGRGVVDFKHQKSNPKYPIKPWESHPVQISAYWVSEYGLPITDDGVGANIYVSSTERGRVAIVWYDAAKLRQCWDVFLAVCAVWRYLHNFDPRQSQ